MKKYINPEIELNVIDTGDIMSGSDEKFSLISQLSGDGGSLDFGSQLGLKFD